MMANWDLKRLLEDIRSLEVPITLVVGANDEAVAPAQSEEIARRIPRARLVRLPRLGHLAHEEDPRAVADLVFAMEDDDSPA